MTEDEDVTDSDDEEGDAAKAAKRAAKRAAALPDGWTEHHDERSDRMYWYNNTSGVSSWIRPTCSPRAGARGSARARPRIVPGQLGAIAEAPAAKKATAAAKLPKGWEKTWSEPHGRFYYFSHVEARSCWTVPTAAAKVPPPGALAALGAVAAASAGASAAVGSPSSAAAAIAHAEAAEAAAAAVAARPPSKADADTDTDTDDDLLGAAMRTDVGAIMRTQSGRHLRQDLHPDLAKMLNSDWAANAPPPRAPHPDEPPPLPLLLRCTSWRSKRARARRRSTRC